MDDQIVETDKRGRVSVGYPERRYRMTKHSDGTLVLEPAIVMSPLEQRFLANVELQAQISYARQHPEDRVVRKSR